VVGEWKYTGIGLGAATTKIAVNNNGGNETRVKNVALLPCIKF
jgi:hypothetical protein